MLQRSILVSLFLCFGTAVWAEGAFITAGYEHARLDPALQRVKGNPDRHVLIYLGAYGCGPCEYTAHQLNMSEVASKLRPQVVVVEGFAWRPRDQGDCDLAARHGWRPSWASVPSFAPVIAVVDSDGQEVLKLIGGLKNTQEALLLGDFLTGKHYRRTNFKSYVAENWN